MRGLVKFDRRTGKSELHAIPEDDQNSEPIFVPRHPESDEGDGWVLACVYRAASDTTDVAIIDARRFTCAPKATVRLPRRIPAGFHGAWLPTSAG